MSRIQTEKQQNSLNLMGELDVHSLNDLWKAQNTLLSNVTHIDVANVTRVDSSGLATLVYFCNQYDLKLTGISPQLQTLIELYDLQTVINQ
ncbi:anti-sigma B factor antagonist [Gilliamella apicola]|uniref:Anti-sigma B factor antagonist n=1 Tax=Gilliamella apicola TaxID=1196095 RepID=A0A2V4DW15_9GAMM|nr:STAS domain-containing protein [Gilliamella apicola]PXZ04985.1 anti-sigma B factor antagonist [Gilliamella apicola]